MHKRKFPYYHPAIPHLIPYYYPGPNTGWLDLGAAGVALQWLVAMATKTLFILVQLADESGKQHMVEAIGKISLINISEEV